MAATPQDTGQSRGLRESFQNVQNSEFVLREALRDSLEDYEIRKLDQFVADELLSGKGDASILQMGRRVIASAAGAMQALALKSEEKQKQADSDAHFMHILALIKDGQVSSYIADEIFDNKTDLEIRDIVAEIEAATGDSFENYAKGILGDEVPKRLDGENDTDHQRRVLKAVAEEVLHPDTGEVKAKYVDDPVAKIVQREQVYHEIRRDVDSLNERAEREGTTVEINNDVDDNTVNNYNAADLHGNGLNADLLSKTATNNQDAETDNAANSVELVSENSDFFDAVTPEDSKIAKVSGDSRNKFNEMSQGELAQNNIVTAKLDMDVKPS